MQRAHNLGLLRQCAARKRLGGCTAAPVIQGLCRFCRDTRRRLLVGSRLGEHAASDRFLNSAGRGTCQRVRRFSCHPRGSIAGLGHGEAPTIECPCHRTEPYELFAANRITGVSQAELWGQRQAFLAHCAQALLDDH